MVTLLPSDIRNSDTASAMVKLRKQIPVRLYLIITDSPGVGGLQVVIRAYPNDRGPAVEITTGGALVASPGVWIYEMGYHHIAPDATGNVMESTPRPIPKYWDALVKHADGTPYTYQLTAEYSV